MYLIPKYKRDYIRLQESLLMEHKDLLLNIKQEKVVKVRKDKSYQLEDKNNCKLSKVKSRAVILNNSLTSIN